MCELCEDELDAVLDGIHERHDEVGERLDVLKGLRVRLNEAFAQLREDASLGVSEEELEEVDENLLDDDDEDDD